MISTPDISALLLVIWSTPVHTPGIQGYKDTIQC